MKPYYLCRDAWVITTPRKRNDMLKAMLEEAGKYANKAKGGIK
jgi:hypothetical protein